MRETSASKPSDQASLNAKTTSKPELSPCSGKSIEETYLLSVQCPVHRGRDSDSGFRTELENLTGDVKRKGTSGEPTRPKVPMRQSEADCPVVLMKSGNADGGKGAGHRRQD
jgi:hypothetical protein